MLKKKSVLRRIASFAIALVALVSAFSVNVGATDGTIESSGYATSRMNNGAQVINYFQISSGGLLEVCSEVYGTSSLTTGCTIEIQLQRKGLLWWSDVDGGYWNESFTGIYGSIAETLQLTKTGKYRAVFTITVSGTGGADDVIEETLTYEY